MRTRSLFMTALLGIVALSSGQAMAYETCTDAVNAASPDLVGAGSIAWSTVGAVRNDNATLVYSGTNVCDRKSGSTFYQAVDVYYKYQATTSGFIDVTLANCAVSGSGTLSSGIGVSLWDCGTGLAVACDRITSASTACNAKITFSANSGQTYIVRVATFATTSSGTAVVTRATGNLVFTPLIPPTNENCATAAPISPGNTVAWNDLLAQVNGPLPTCGGLGNATQESGQRDLWYLYTATTTGLAQAKIVTNSNSFVISAAPAAGGCPNAANTYCKTDFVSTNTPLVLSFPITNGSSYYIRIARTAPEAAADGTLSIVEWTTPANDTCGTAANIAMSNGTGTATWNDVAAHADAPFPDCGVGSAVDQRDVWYNYQATQTGNARFVLSGSGSFTNNTITIFSDCSGTTVLDCKVAPFAGCIAVTNGTSYKVRVSRPANADTNNRTLTVTEYQPGVEGETCQTPLDIPSDGVYSLNNTGFCDSAEDLAFGCAGANIIWLRYTPTMSGIAVFNTVPPNPDNNNGVDTTMSAFSNCNTMIECNFDRAHSYNGGSSYISFPVVQNVPVLVRIGAPFNVTYPLNVFTVPAYVNDECAGAQTIILPPSNSTRIDYDNLNATTSANAFTCVGPNGAGQNDLWWKWTAPSNGAAVTGTCWNNAPLTSSYLSILSVYDNSCGGTVVACNDDYEGVTEPEQCSDSQSFTSFNPVAGHTYYIRVGGQNDYLGSGKLYLRFTPAPCAADFNGDHVRDVADLFGYINAWLAKTINADFNHDTVVDVADLFGFINAWLAGC